MNTLTSSISLLSLGTGAEIHTAPPEPAADRPRWIGHDHLLSLGFADEQIRGWIASGVLSSPQGDGFYLRTPEFEVHFARLTMRRVIGRGHLLALGATPGLIARWLSHRTLRRTANRGFYEITRAALDKLRPSSPPEVPAALDPPVVEPPAKLRIVPCTITRARTFVAEHHRHLAPPVSGLFAVGIARGEELVGVAIVGRPVARELLDGRTAEVTRVCTGGERNACSMLLSACPRVPAARHVHPDFRARYVASSGGLARGRVGAGPVLELPLPPPQRGPAPRQAAMGGASSRCRCLA